MPFIDLPDRIPGLRAQARRDQPWYRITNQAADEAEVMLYDEVGGWLGATADEFINDLRGITAPNILLRVNSPGGSVTEGIAIANALRSHPANVTVQVDGVAASIASVIAMAGDHIRMMPNALLMVHEASGLCVGEAADMIKMAELLDKISDNIAGAYSARAGGTEAEWRQVMKNETWYRGDEAVAAGLADEVVPMPKRGDGASEPEMQKQFDLAAYGYTGPAKPEAPKPGPPPAAPSEQQPQLVISIADVLDEETVAKLRAAFAQPVEPAAPTVADTATGVHHTATENSAWDGPGAVSAMPNDKATLRYCHAWYDPDGDPEAKASYKFPHHRKQGGPANLAACRNGLARLDSADIPDGERDGVRKHLQAHLDDAKGADDRAPAVDEPSAAAVPAAETDEWADMVAHLTQPEPDPWAELVSHLTEPTASSSAATEAA